LLVNIHFVYILDPGLTRWRLLMAAKGKKGKKKGGKKKAAKKK